MSGRITLDVVQDGILQVRYKIKTSQKLRKLMNHYSRRRGVSPEFMRFFFRGVQFGRNETPEQRGMQNGDTIVVQ